LNHRERVITSISLNEPDRIPLDLGSTSSLIVDSVYFKLKKLLKIDSDIKPFRSGSTANYYDERILEKLDIDFRHVWFDSPDRHKPIFNPDKTVTDSWGITWSTHGSFPVYFPLKNASFSELKKYNYPLPEKKWDLKRKRKG
jgi:uroporphyrinogen decarboxylase